MFDQIVAMVKEHLGNNPQLAGAIPADQQDAVHKEIATHIVNNMPSQATAAGGLGGIVSKLENTIVAGGPVTSAIEGSLVSSLANKFGLPPAVTGAIAGALPGLLQKFSSRQSS